MGMIKKSQVALSFLWTATVLAIAATATPGWVVYDPIALGLWIGGLAAIMPMWMAFQALSVAGVVFGVVSCLLSYLLLFNGQLSGNRKIIISNLVILWLAFLNQAALSVTFGIFVLTLDTLLASYSLWLTVASGLLYFITALIFCGCRRCACAPNPTGY